MANELEASWDQKGPPVGAIWVRRCSVTVNTKFGAETKRILMSPPHKAFKGRLYRVPLFPWKGSGDGVVLA